MCCSHLWKLVSTHPAIIFQPRTLILHIKRTAQHHHHPQSSKDQPSRNLCPSARGCCSNAAAVDVWQCKRRWVHEGSPAAATVRLRDSRHVQALAAVCCRMAPRLLNCRGDCAAYVSCADDDNWVPGGCWRGGHGSSSGSSSKAIPSAYSKGPCAFCIQVIFSALKRSNPVLLFTLTCCHRRFKQPVSHDTLYSCSRSMPCTSSIPRTVNIPARDYLFVVSVLM